jgi:hypothetical protein
LSAHDDDFWRPNASGRIGLCLLILCGLVLLGGIGVMVAFVYQREAWISRGNYARIHRGMSEADVMRLLGSPDHDMMQFGLVSAAEGPGAYAANFLGPTPELRKRGYEDYRFLQWASPEITIVIICNKSGSVAAKYTAPGQERSMQSWFNRTMRAFRTSP